MDKIPVNIISGFLGSGKTTAIIKLFEQKTNNEHWAVIINEYGKVSIDSQTLRSSSSNAGMIFEVSGGCICCSAKGYFQENLEKIVRNGDFTRIIIEPSGLGGIDMVSEIVDANPELRLMPVICIVDITSIENLRIQLNPIYRMQICKAAFIEFSKCDLITDASLLEKQINKFESLFQNKKYCIKLTDTNFWPSPLNKNFLMNPKENKHRMIPADDQKLLDSNYEETSYIFGKDTIFDSDRLLALFIENPLILRAKGHLQTKNGWNLLNYTLSGCTFESCQEKKQNEIVVIGEKSDSIQFHYFIDKIERTIIQQQIKKKWAEAHLLHQTFIGKGEVSFRSKNQVIQCRNVEKLPCFMDFLGQVFVCFTGNQVARWMIVRKYDTAGIRFQRGLHDNPDICHRSTQSS